MTLDVLAPPVSDGQPSVSTPTKRKRKKRTKKAIKEARVRREARNTEIADLDAAQERKDARYGKKRGKKTARWYQIAGLDAAKSRYGAGVARQLIVLPTGAGKTPLFALVIAYLGLKKRILVVVHRKELSAQAMKTFKSWAPNVTVGVEMDGKRASGEQVVIAGVQTIGKDPECERLLALNPDDFDLVIIDEAHHSTAETWKTVLKHFGFLDAKGHKQTPPNGRLLIGVTATPDRADENKLLDIFDEIVFELPILRAIKEGWIVTPRAWRIFTTTNLDNVREVAGKLVDADLTRAINTRERNTLIVDKWLEMSERRPTIAFTNSVAHARTLAETFSK
jgi:ATP-dependent helicase IRC3